MIGLDTNVLVRFLTQDDARQARKADAVMGELTPQVPGYLPTVVVVELYWVLTRAYELDRDEVIDVLRELVGNASLVTQDNDIVTRALVHAAAGADLADAVIAESCSRAGCAEVVSFDRRAVKQLGFSPP